MKLNLAEYAGGSDDGEEAVTRRYLMQESKINSTLKVWTKKPPSIDVKDKANWTSDWYLHETNRRRQDF